jgi:hypothetical protein
VGLAIFEMADINEQRTNIKFSFKLGKTFTETHEMMPSSCDKAHVAQVREIVRYNRRLTVREIAEEISQQYRYRRGFARSR